jgi:AcrR family transcriptional regulator
MITKELIIETATKSFLQNGVKSVTIDSIVKELHTSKRTIYAHFNDKIALLGACLDTYNNKVKEENEAIIKSSENVLEAMANLHQQIIRRSYEVNPNFFRDVLNYYPGVLDTSYRNTGKFAHKQLIFLAQWGIRDGIFQENMDIEVVGKTVLVMQKLLKDKNRFPVAEFSIERLTFGILLPYLKGLCTPKGINLLEIQEELFKVSI